MLRKFTVILLLTILALGATEDECKVHEAEGCIDAIGQHLDLQFPSFGENEQELDKICKHLNQSFECAYDYVGMCHDHKDCKDECLMMIRKIQHISSNTGLEDLTTELCNENSSLREKYLNNAECLKENAEQFETCHNKSEQSQLYISEIKELELKKDAACCYYTWFRDCFQNITKKHCSSDATFFVSFSLDKINSYNIETSCGDKVIQCSKPPLYNLKDRNSSPSSFQSVSNWLLSCFVAMSIYMF